MNAPVMIGTETPVRITDRAAQKLREFMKSEGKEGHGVRLAVVGGCCSAQYQMAFEEASREGDQVIPYGGFDLFLDPMSAGKLAGIQVDWVEGPQGTGFKIEETNEAGGGCGCKH